MIFFNFFLMDKLKRGAAYVGINHQRCQIKDTPKFTFNGNSCCELNLQGIFSKHTLIYRATHPSSISPSFLYISSYKENSKKKK